MLTSFSPLLKGFALESLGNAPTINREMTHEKGKIGYNHPDQTQKIINFPSRVIVITQENS